MMQNRRREMTAAILIVLASLAGAALILMIPSVVRSQGDFPMWIPAALGVTFLVLALAAGHQRRKLLPSRE